MDAILDDAQVGLHLLRVTQGEEEGISFQRPINHGCDFFVAVVGLQVDRDPGFGRCCCVVAKLKHRPVIKVHLNPNIDFIKDEPTAHSGRFDTDGHAGGDGGPSMKPGRWPFGRTAKGFGQSMTVEVVPSLTSQTMPSLIEASRTPVP